MSKSYSKIRHIQKSNLLIEGRLLMEQEVKMVQGSTWACYTGAEGPPPDYEIMKGNQIEFYKDDSSEQSLGKVYLPNSQRTRGQFCGTPSQEGTSVVLTSDRGKYICTTDCLPT